MIKIDHAEKHATEICVLVEIVRGKFAMITACTCMVLKFERLERLWFGTNAEKAEESHANHSNGIQMIN